MMKCGLLGQKLGHSYSPQIHSHLGSYSYSLFEREPEELADFLKNGDFTGLNVTLPYKKAVIPYLDELSPEAERMGAVNTIVRRNGKLIGHNTDFFGFRSMVEKSGIHPAGKKALVLGSGGASNTAVAVLQDLGAHVVVISRSGENHYGNLHIHSDAAFIVNTTPVGMYPNTGVSPLSLGQFPSLEGVLDVVYNPARTKLLMDAEERGLIAMNGLWMLVAQAKESAQWFTESEIPDAKIPQIHSLLKAKMENIILIGMPGSGKSTVARLLAQRLNREFVDADEEIVKISGMCIPEIFATGGEDAFRKIESQVLSALGKQSGLIIATGGGCVTRQENYPSLHQNGTVIWLHRNLNLLPTHGRPLSQKGSLEAMYQERAPLYEAFTDYSVDNNGTTEETVEKILTLSEVHP